DADSVQFALGMKLTHDREKGTASLSMEAYFDRVFTKFGMDNLKPKSTPLPPGIALSVDQSPQNDEDRAFMRNKPY
ncbi:hypothetical protein EV361DRAFT_775370, partial [Lentinula raphanica]